MTHVRSFLVGILAVFRRVNARHVGGRRLRTILTLSGIAAGVALAFSIAVINETLLSSFRASIRELAGAAEIEVAASDRTGLPDDALVEVESVEGVERAVPVVREMSELRGPGGSERTMVLGVTPEISTLFPTETSPLTDLRISDGAGFLRGGIFLSQRVADEIGRTSGDRVFVETPSGSRAVEVAGTLSGRSLAVLNGGNVAVMPLADAQDTFAKTGRIDSIYVVVAADRSVASVEGAIEDALQAAAVVGPPGERGEGLERVFSGLGTLLSLTGTVSLFVALFVVYNTMSIALAERRREISMALAFGASRAHIFGAFLFEAALLGTVAAAVGLAGGLLLARVLVEPAVNAYRILPLAGAGPLVVRPSDVVLALAAGVSISLLGAFLPARRVLAVAPVESLRPHAAYEWETRSFAGLRARFTGIAGIGALAASVVLVAAYTLRPESGWIANLGLVLGLTGVTLLLPRIVPFAVAVVRPLMSRAFATAGRLASDALAKNPGRTTFTVAALVLSLSVAVGAGSALGSYERQVEASASALIGADFYVTSKSYSGFTSDQPLAAGLRDELSDVDGVDYVYPLRFSLVNIGDEQGLIYTVPIREVLEQGATTELSAITDDPQAYVDGLEAGGVAISPLTAERHSLEVGDSITLPTPSGKQDFPVVGLFNDLVSFDSLYMDYETYVREWNDDKADEFGVLLADGVSEAQARRDLEAFIRQEGVPADVYTKDELVGRILEIVEGSLSLGRGIQLAALLVAALVIANTMFTTVLERRWEIGLERAIGMGGGQVARTVLLEAAAIGVIGGVGGAALGLATGYLWTQVMEAQFAWQISFRPSFALVALAVGGATVLAALAGVIPSRMAARAPIIESLRYE